MSLIGQESGAAQPCWTLLGAGSQSQTSVGAVEGPQTRGRGERGQKAAAPRSCRVPSDAVSSSTFLEI